MQLFSKTSWCRKASETRAETPQNTRPKPRALKAQTQALQLLRRGLRIRLIMYDVEASNVAPGFTVQMRVKNVELFLQFRGLF